MIKRVAQNVYVSSSQQYDVNGDGKPGGGGEYEVQVFPSYLDGPLWSPLAQLNTYLSCLKPWLSSLCEKPAVLTFFTAGFWLDQRSGPAAPGPVWGRSHLRKPTHVL